jgi:metal-responsive CopG/Arc/MetJ family transcriptional regulator
MKQKQIPKNRIIGVRFPGDKSTTSIVTPENLRGQIDDVLAYIHIKTKVKFSRNEFIMKALRFYLEYLLQLSNSKEVIESINS